MPRPAYRSRSKRRVYVKTPGGRVVIHYESRRPGSATCAFCGKPLSGVPRLNPSGLRKLAKTEKRPQRIYGGVFCVNCLERFLKRTIRSSLASATPS